MICHIERNRFERYEEKEEAQTRSTLRRSNGVRSEIRVSFLLHIAVKILNEQSPDGAFIPSRTSNLEEGQKFLSCRGILSNLEGGQFLFATRLEQAHTRRVGRNRG